jgi:hypothetical protein
MKMFAALPKEGKVEFLDWSEALGSSNVAKYQKTPKRPRGKKGLTRMGRRKVIYAARQVEKAYGKDCASFGTVTLPIIPIGVEEGWARFVELIIQMLRYRMEAAGIPWVAVWVTENQAKRAARAGQFCPHLHIAFVGRKPGKAWGITPKKFDRIIRKAYESVWGKTEGANWKSCGNIQRIKKSVERYLSKYMTKGCQGIQSGDTGENGKGYVSAWYGMTMELKRGYAKTVRRLQGTQAVEMLSFLQRQGSSLLTRGRNVTRIDSEGREYIVGWSGAYRPEVTWEQILEMAIEQWAVPED